MSAISNLKALRPAGACPDHEKRLAALLQQGLGLASTRHNLSALAEECRHRARGMDIAEVAYLDLLSSDGASARTEWVAIAPALTVGETFLFRDPALWNLIETQLLPSIKSLTRPLWLWSAGCSTGEEAYTLAIVASRVLVPGSFTVLGTDVNSNSITAARFGVYTPWSMRGTNMTHDGLIVSGTQAVRIHDDVKKTVRFQTHNLSDASSFPPPGIPSFEFILCRNVLIYMAASARADLISALSACLSPGGILVLGHGEASGIKVSGLKAEAYDAGVIYRKPLVQAVADITPPALPRVRGRTGGRAVAEHPKTRVQKSRAIGGQYRAFEAIQRREGEETSRAHALLVEAVAQARAGHTAAAEGTAAAALALNPLSPQAHVLLAALFASRDAFEDSEKSLKRALFLDPASIPALWQLGALYKMMQRGPQATFIFARLLARLEGLPPDQDALPFDNLSIGELNALLRSALGETK
jgi:chemotaxis protein methyltransferase CheR